MISTFAPLTLLKRMAPRRIYCRRLFGLCLGLVVFGGLLVQEARATDFMVNLEDDPHDEFGACFSEGACSLRQAVNSSNAHPTDDRIRFASNLQRVVLSVVINNLEFSRPDILVILNGRLSIEGPGRDLLRIEGDIQTPHRIFDLRPGTSNAFSISGVTITGGRGRGSHSTFDRDLQFQCALEGLSIRAAYRVRVGRIEGFGFQRAVRRRVVSRGERK